MWSRSISRTPAGVVAAALSMLGLCGALAYLPSQPPGLSNFDKRAAEGARDTGRDPAHRAAREKLNAQVPDARVELDAVTGSPKSITSSRGFLSGPNGTGKAISAEAARAFAADDPHRAVKAFLNDHAALFSHDASALNGARVMKDYVTPNNGLHTVVWQQHLDDIPVFEAMLTGHTTRNGELASLSSHFVPLAGRAADNGVPNRRALQLAPAIPAEQAVVIAAANVGEKPTVDQVRKQSAWADEKDGVRRYSAPGLNGATQVKRTWLPMNRTTLRLCWEVILTSRTRGEMFRVLVDAQTGEALVRHCLTAYISDATYRVYTGDSPSPFSPGPSTPLTNQPPLVPRVLIVTNAVNTNASPLGWINDGANITAGNNVDAHLDRNADDTADLPRTTGSPFRVFDFPLDLAQPPTSYGDAAVVQLFYLCNYYHDRVYELGFTEAAGNFQVNNFGRGGLGGDAVQADAQDGSGTDNANFSTPPDGSPGRMQMYTFTGPNPDRDGDLDAEIVFHEHTHGLSGRLVGGGVGISESQTGGMGEGWSDWYGLCLLSEPGDDLNGNYAAGGYVTYLLGGTLTQNYYFGIRRYPYTTDLTKNPLTFKDIDPSQASSHPGVPRNLLVGGGGADEVHNQGEVWCVTLWEARANLINKLGFAAGNRLILQLVTDAMKLGPANPNFLQARDAIILADRVDTGGANFNELWAAFAKRGMGFSATSPSSSTTAGVQESFDVPDDLLVNPANNLVASGPVGGPFSPASQAYVLTNISTNMVVWTSTIHADWLTLSSASGTLAPGAPGAAVNVSVNAAANLLPMGVYTDTLTFTNQTTGRRQTRQISLRVGQPDFFTEAFTGNDNDLAFQTFTFTPDGSSSFYSVCRDVATNFPTDPIAGIPGPACDDCFTAATLTGTNRVSVYGTNSSSVLYIGSNGYITLGSGTNDLVESALAHFSLVRVSALFDDLNPASAGSVSWKQLSNRVAVTWSKVPEYGAINTNDFQIELFFNGTIRLTYLRVDARDGLVGLSAGRGVPLAFEESDFDTYGPCVPPLLVTAPAVATEGAGVLVGQGAVRIPSPLSSNLTVTLASSDLTEATVPASVVLLAGNTSAAFDITIVDDGILDGTQTATVTATVTGYADGSASVRVFDRQSGALALSLPADATEGDWPLLGAVFVSEIVGKNVRVELSSSDTTEIQVPSFVVVPAGQDWATFYFAIVDDTEIDGPKRAIVRAHVANWLDGASFITVQDNESLNLAVSLPLQAREGDGVLVNTGSVQLSGTLPTNLVVALRSGDTTEVTVPPSVTILAGQFSAAFDLTIIDDPDLDGPQSALVTASATGFNSGSASIIVQDDETPPVPSNPRPADLATNVPANTNLFWSSVDRVSELIINGGFETGDFTGWVRQPSGPGDFVINDGTFDPPSADGPLPPFAGNYSALGQQAGPGLHSIYQQVSLPANASGAVLQWAHRLRNFYGGGWTPDQEFRVEIRDTNNATLAVAFVTQPGDPLLDDWVTKSFDVSAFIGQTIRVVFIVNPGGFNLDVHLDNVSLQPAVSRAPTTFDVYFGANPTPGPAEFQGSTTNTSWDLPLLAPLQTYYWQIVSRRLGTNTGPIWRFTTRGVDHFEWSAISSPQILSQPFGATITAKDAFNTTVSNFTGTVNLAGLIGSPSPASLLVNGNFETGNFSGWVKENSGDGDFVLNSGSLDPNSPDGPLPPYAGSFSAMTDQAGAGAHALYQEITIPPNAVSVSLTWADRIRNHASQYQHPNQEFRVEIRGPLNNLLAIADSTNPGDPLLNDWAQRSYDLGAFRGQTIRIAFVEQDNLLYFNLHVDDVAVTATLSQPVAVSPTVSANFTNGAWTGNIAVPEVVNGVHLQADDGAGHTGQSNPFDVLALDDLSVTVVDSPDPVAVGANLTYAINILNSGPSAATGVSLTNYLPASATLVSFLSSQGGCSNVSGKILCGLGSLAGGSNVTVTIVVRPNVVGSITNIAVVSRSGPDPYLPNNTVVALTTVTPPSLSISSVSLTEGNIGTINAIFTVTLAGTHAQTVTVSYATADGSARASLDYFPTNGTLTFSPIVSSQTVVVRVIGDTLIESNELFFVTLSNPTNAIIRQDRGVGTILNDDGLPGRVDHFVWDLVPSPQDINVPFGVRITAQDALDATVTNYAGTAALSGLPGKGTAGAGRNVLISGVEMNSTIQGYLTDLGHSSTLVPPNALGSVSFAGYDAMWLGGATTFNGLSGRNTDLVNFINAGGNLLVEIDGSNNPMIDYPFGGQLAPVYVAGDVVRIVDLTHPLSAGLTDAGLSGWQTSYHSYFTAPGTFKVVMDNGVSGNWVTVSLAAGRGNITFSGLDVAFHIKNGVGPTGPGSPKGVFLDNALRVTASGTTFAITPTNSGNFIGGVWTGTVAVLTPGSNVVLAANDRDGHSGGSNPFEVRLHNDIGVAVTEAPDPVALGENLTYSIAVANVGPAVATGVILSNILPASAAFVSVTTSQGTCSNAGGTVLCDLGTLAADTNVTIAIVATATTLGNITNRVSVTRAEADGFPNNNTAVAVTSVQRVSLYIYDTSLSEGDTGTTNAVFTVELSPVTAKTVRANYVTANLTAVAGSDFLSTNGTLTFLPGETSKTINVRVLGDIVWELDETFLVNLSSPSNAVLGRSRGTNTIRNDDPFPSLSISDTEVLEGNVGTTNALFTVSLFPPSSQTVTLQYSTFDGTASAGTDYVTIGNGTLTLFAGQTNATISVTVKGDVTNEPDETFFVYLTGSTNADIDDDQGLAWIRNDDGLPSRIDHFAWNVVPSPQLANVPFGVTITARDAFDATVTGFSNTVSLSAGRSGGSRTNSILGNVVETSTAFGDYTLGYAFTPGTNLMVTHVRHYFGTKVSIWTDAGVLLASQNVTSVPGSWWETALSAPLQLVAGQRYRLAAYTGVGGTTFYARSDGPSTFSDGTIDQEYYADGDGFPGFLDGWRWMLVDLRYTAATSIPVALTPINSGNFSNGVWAGLVAVQTTGTNVQLKADDRAGHSSFGNAFNVFAPGDLSLALSGSPGPLATNALLTYILSVFNPGPAPATGLLLSNFLPGGVTFVSATSSQGTCANLGGIVQCSLGTLPANSNVLVQILLSSPSVFGDITNRATVTQNEADPNLANNSAVAITSVPDFPPAVNLSSPLDGTVFLFPVNITLVAAATDRDGMITKVGFYGNGIKLGETTNQPYSIIWTNASPGSAALTARATDNGGNVATSAPVTITVLPPPPGRGLGLSAEYFDNRDFTSLLVTRIDPVINFDESFGDWPPPPIGLATFSVRWTGYVQPRYSDLYTFYTLSDDGVRFYVNDQLIINNFTDHTPTENSGTIALQAGQLYSIRMEYYQQANGAAAALSWSSANQTREFIPQSQLYPVPVIATNPVSRVANPGTNVTFTVTAFGQPTLAYQWRSNDVNITGAASANLQLNNVQIPSSAGYSVVVSNSYGAVTSAVATLVVGVRPAISADPQSRIVLSGSNVALTVSAAGTLPLSYRWRKNPGGLTLTNMILNASNSVYSLPNVQTNDAGIYTVAVTNVFGTVTNRPTGLTSNAVLSVVGAQTTNAAAGQGSNVSFTISAASPNPLSFQWLFNLTNALAGATNVGLTVTNLQATHAGTYHAVVTNAAGSVTTLVATLTVILRDTDQDGLPDDWEIAHRLDPFDPSDATADPDGDGMSNRDEYAAGTDPQDLLSVLRVSLFDGGNGGALIRFTAMPNIGYTLQYRTNLVLGPWRFLREVAARPGTNAVEFLDPDAGASGRRFYRIATPQRP